MSAEDLGANKVYCLCRTEVLAGEIFMSKPVSELFLTEGSVLVGPLDFLHRVNSQNLQVSP